MSKNSCVAAEKHGTCVLRMARVNCNLLQNRRNFVENVYLKEKLRMI